MHFKRVNKFNVAPPNKRTFRGRTYDSKAEMDYAIHLLAQIEAGVVIDFCEQPKVHVSGDLWYKPDFMVIEPERAYYVDVKGVERPEFVNLCRIWTTTGRLPLHVVKRKGKVFITERIHGDPQ